MFSLIVYIVIVMKNLFVLVNGFVVLLFMLNIVFIIVVNKKNKINYGNIFDNLIVVVEFFLEWYKVSDNVIGIMVRVFVSLIIVV